MSIIDTLKFIVNHPVNKANKIAAVGRYFKWQVGSRLVPGGVAYDWVDGARILVHPGDKGLTGNIYCGLHEFKDMAYLLHVIKEGDLFVDVGANAGSYTILACAARGAYGYAIEPIPFAYRKLKENVNLNNLTDKVNCLNIGVSDSRDILYFTSTHDTTNHVLNEHETNVGAIKVQVDTIDCVLKGKTPSVMKIDVEGYEKKVLEGATNILSSPQLHSVILELNGSGKRYGIDETDITLLMNNFGFFSYDYDPFNRKLIELGGRNMNSGNTLFIRHKETVLPIIESAECIAVYGTKI